MGPGELDEELTAIDAIYPNCTERIGPEVLRLRVPGHEELEVEMRFSLKYPAEKPQVMRVASFDRKRYADERYLLKLVEQCIERVFRPGEVCIFQFLAELEDVFEKYEAEREGLDLKSLEVDEAHKEEQQKDGRQDSGERSRTNCGQNVDLSGIEQQDQDQDQDLVLVLVLDPLAGWTQGDPIVDRGSTFIGFSRRVNSVEEAKQFLEVLVTDKKVSKAHHNISSWRIKCSNGVQYQDFDDDGETAAGSRVLHLLTLLADGLAARNLAPIGSNTSIPPPETQ